MFGRFRTIWFVFAFHVLCCSGKDLTEEEESEDRVDFKLLERMRGPVPGPQEVDEQSKQRKSELDMEDAIQKIEILSQIAEQMNKVNDLISEEDVSSLYDHMIQAVDRIQDAIVNPDNIYNFMKANGVLRVLSTNLKNTDSTLRTKLLLVLKEIFDQTTDLSLPINIIDRLIDIFENDNNLALKAHALDILHKWLPNNPEAQVRVMKISGLEAFYKQIDKLDIGVVQKLIDLFNIILKEHLDVRNGEQIFKDADKTKLYQSIGIIEHISNPKVCNGLFNIFDLLWSYNRTESDKVKLVLELLINVKQFCLKYYKKNKAATNLFEAILKYVLDEDKKAYLEKLGTNVTNVQIVLEEYVHKEKRGVQVKDEF